VKHLNRVDEIFYSAYCITFFFHNQEIQTKGYTLSLLSSLKRNEPMLIVSSHIISLCPFPLSKEQNDFTKLGLNVISKEQNDFTKRGLKVIPLVDAPEMYFIIFYGLK
jgi:hypothetical protein